MQEIKDSATHTEMIRYGWEISLIFKCCAHKCSQLRYKATPALQKSHQSRSAHSKMLHIYPWIIPASFCVLKHVKTIQIFIFLLGLQSRSTARTLSVLSLTSFLVLRLASESETATAPREPTPNRIKSRRRRSCHRRLVTVWIFHRRTQTAWHGGTQPAPLLFHELISPSKQLEFLIR